MLCGQCCFADHSSIALLLGPTIQYAVRTIGSLDHPSRTMRAHKHVYVLLFCCGKLDVPGTQSQTHLRSHAALCRRQHRAPRHARPWECPQRCQSIPLVKSAVLLGAPLADSVLPKEGKHLMKVELRLHTTAVHQVKVESIPGNNLLGEHAMAIQRGVEPKRRRQGVNEVTKVLRGHGASGLRIEPRPSIGENLSVLELNLISGSLVLIMHL
mmetsp:Transcript_20982/g.47032  ORF Transcript_20982/g.47032 Transcript_20982/m.47032 type:complete len:212 (-) Transcript_20982:2332-2967(-)